MPNDLVPLSPSPEDNAEPIPPRHYEADEEAVEEWDLPPEEMGYGPRPDGAGPDPMPRAAQKATDDASRARSLGDTTFAAVREGDAGDLTQSRWDWGDLRTWLWFGAMFFGFLILVALCYFLPEGRHASPPPARLY